jgi:cytochrome c-type biogenesis protein CcmH
VTFLRRWGGWLAIAAVALVGLGIAVYSPGPPSAEARERRLEQSVRCPQCSGQSVASSDAASATAVRKLIVQQVAAGRSDEEIRDYLAGRYGQEILLDPSNKGFDALVWGIPVTAAIIAIGALVYRFRDWRPGDRHATADDRVLVEDALEHRR